MKMCELIVSHGLDRETNYRQGRLWPRLLGSSCLIQFGWSPSTSAIEIMAQYSRSATQGFFNSSGGEKLINHPQIIKI
uniref:GG11089 n=1 Tax=Drosophila erecta TaxID=7220 RepID=B3P2B2_DROER